MYVETKMINILQHLSMADMIMGDFLKFIWDQSHIEVILEKNLFAGALSI